MAGLVTVVSKHPQRIMLRLHEIYEVDEPVLGGGVRRSKASKPIEGTGKTVMINGWATAHGQTRTFALSNGYALTRNVDADFWKAYCEQNKGSPLLVNGVLSAFAKDADFAAFTKEHVGMKTGLEPVNPNATIKMGAVEISKGEDMPRVDYVPIEEMV